MTLDEVTIAMQNGSIVEHTHLGITCRYRISGVITRYNPVKGWHYSLELHDLKANSVTIAGLEDIKISEGK